MLFLSQISQNLFTCLKKASLNGNFQYGCIYLNIAVLLSFLIIKIISIDYTFAQPPYIHNLY